MAKKNGGIEAVEKRNNDKAKLIYDEIDNNELFVGFANTEDRSAMNATNLVNDNHSEIFNSMFQG